MKPYRVITIEREYASGGSEIGQKLSEKLGIPVYGKEFLNYLAKTKGIIPENIKDYEETSTNSLLYSLHVLGEIFQGKLPEISPAAAVNTAEQELICKAADLQSCIIIGRCAGWALRKRSDVLNVFITADEAFRRQRAVSTYHVAENAAEAALNKYDRRRAAFYKEHTGENWYARQGYHMVLSSSKLGIEKCVKLIGCASEISPAI